ncbi:MAG: bifunctional oligoribonuclease/PAP phosphatase NrnA [Clostridiales bacterium]|jgi:phosphoesterase RecJ-like protein|nr:bifunctional oligoribonuclease/PAP phosphatase NrnA [Clostridiales bacterium]
MKSLHELAFLLRESESIVITGHKNPDGDAVGACLAMAMGLAGAGKRPLVVLEEYNEKFLIIPGREYICKDIGRAAQSDAIIALDCAGLEIMTDSGKRLWSAFENTFNIDHHVSNKYYARHNFVADSASSACELVFDALNPFVAIDERIGTALYAGMVYDTGGFRHSSTSPETLQKAARLMALGVPFSKIYNELMFSHSLLEAKIFARALARLVVEPGYPIAVSYITPEDFAQTGALQKDVDGVVAYMANLREAQVSLLAYEKEKNLTKCSLRSGCLDVAQIAARFGGGGHRLAAGCNFDGAASQALGAILPIIKSEMRINGQ